MKKRVLIIDPQKHFPLAVKMFDNADYFSPRIDLSKIPTIQPVMTHARAEELYGVKILEEEDVTGEYDLAVIVWAINSLGDWLDARIQCMVPTTVSNLTDLEERQELFHSIYKLIKKVQPKKVVFFDGNDSPLVGKGLKWLDDNDYQCDAVFKREYRRTYAYDYDNRIHPFPFLGGSRADPWFLFEKRVKGNEGIMGCFWSGAPIHRFQPERPDEWCNRRDFLAEVQNFLVIKSGLPQAEFLNQFNQYKFFLHLNGTGHLCGRFFEGLSRDSLMIMQEMDVVFPFDKGENFHKKCVVKTPREFIENLIELANNPKLYDECKNIQELIVEKYYNYEWIKNYVFEKSNAL